MIQKIKNMFASSYTDEAARKNLLYSLLNMVLFLASGTMTVVNIFTDERVLMLATLIYSVICLFNLFLVRLSGMRQIMYYVFAAEAFVLFIFFIVSGIPNGFSVLWTLLVPSFVLAIFRSRMGSVFCITMLGVIIFFFWLPWGRSLLMYEYSETFMLRFPFVYICLFVIALYVENIRMGTWKRLKESESNSRSLYRHDALTGIYSRYAFYEELEKRFEENTAEHVAIAIFDIDDFKKVNDAYGHNTGDSVLKQITGIILDNICEHCIACRWGGEEFLVLMQCEHDPYKMAEGIRKIISTTAMHCEKSNVSVTVSVGIARASKVSKEQISAFINHADNAMYESKLTGKNKTTVIEFDDTHKRKNK